MFGDGVAFGVCVLRGVVDFSCPGGQVEAFRGVSEAFGDHFGGQKPSTTIGKPRCFEDFWKTAFSITRVVQVSFWARVWSLFGALVALLGASCGSFTRHGSLKSHVFPMVFARFRCFGVGWWRLGCVSCALSYFYRVLEAKYSVYAVPIGEGVCGKK